MLPDLVFYGAAFHSLANAASDAGAARQSARDASLRVRELETSLHRTLLVCEALWSLVRERLNLTDDELRQRIEEIDLSDGIRDGKVKRPPHTCPKCNRPVSRRFARCIYCGRELDSSPLG